MIESGDPSFENVILVLFLVGVASFGITEVIKIWCRRLHPKQDGVEDSRWWQIVFRLVPITIGAGAGSMFLTFPWGMVTGVCAGVLAALIYKRVKKMISEGDPPRGLPLP